MCNKVFLPIAECYRLLRHKIRGHKLLLHRVQHSGPEEWKESLCLRTNAIFGRGIFHHAIAPIDSGNEPLFFSRVWQTSPEKLAFDDVIRHISAIRKVLITSIECHIDHFVSHGAIIERHIGLDKPCVGSMVIIRRSFADILNPIQITVFA